MTDYRKKYHELLERVAVIMDDEAVTLGKLTTGNVAHNLAGAACNARQWAKNFREEKQRDQEIPNS